MLWGAKLDEAFQKFPSPEGIPSFLRVLTDAIVAKDGFKTEGFFFFFYFDRTCFEIVTNFSVRTVSRAGASARCTEICVDL